MRVVEIPGGKIVLRESAKELPIHRFTDFQKYAIQSIGIGSEVEDVERHFRNLDTFISHGKLEEAATERFNQHYGIILAINKINIRHICFACFVDTINGEPIKDYSEKNLVEVCDRMGKMGLTDGHVSDILEDLKKKLILN